MKNKKILTSVIAVVAAAALLFGGTFAWQSISQTALNEISASINPGGRLHDDFNDITKDSGAETMSYNKDVYVENFTELANNGVQVYARVRLDEYMELGTGAGLKDEDGKKSESNKAKSIVADATLDDKSTWTTHIYGVENPDDPFHEYWEWDFSGKTVYMPTFNKNKDSLEADINSFKTEDGYTAYAVGDTRDATALYDADAAEDGHEEVDELAEKNISAADVISGRNPLDDSWNKYVERVNETHTAKETLDGYVMTMADYIDKLANDVSFNGTGNFWVYDSDGWAYWANPIEPDTATGLLLDGVQRTKEIINQDWYYAINVVAQFVTADDLGQDDNTGFYDISEGEAPSANALQLLNNIGVEVNFEVATAEQLQEALDNGGTITLVEDVTVSAPLTVSKDTVLNLNGNTISPNAAIWDEPAGNWSLISADGEGVTLIIEGEGGLIADEGDSYCVDVKNGAKVVINGGTYKGNISAVYVHTGEAVISGGSFSIQQTDPNGGYKYVLNCLDENYANGTASITVTGGSFYDFDPSAQVENSGSGNYMPESGYTVTSSTADNTTVYTVIKTTTAE